MSHFVVVVVIPKEESTPDIIEASVEKRLSKYDENMCVEPYLHEMSDGEFARMKEHYKTEWLHELADHMKNWNGNIGAVVNGKLGYWTQFNPDSKWDWWVIGGRWNGYFNADDDRGTNGVNVIPIAEIKDGPVPRAIVTPGGVWHEKGEMGWFGMSFGDKNQEDWRAEYFEVLSAFPNHIAVACDLHI